MIETILAIILGALSIVERAGKIIAKIRSGEDITPEEIDALVKEKAKLDLSWEEQLQLIRDRATIRENLPEPGFPIPPPPSGSDEVPGAYPEEAEDDDAGASGEGGPS